jgi:DNA polymerase-4
LTAKQQSVTEALLARLDLRCIGDVARLDRAELGRRFGKGGAHLWQLARGVDDRKVSPEEGFKSIGHETMFERDTGERQLLHDTMLELAEKVAQRLRVNLARGRTVTFAIEVRTG